MVIWSAFVFFIKITINTHKICEYTFQDLIGIKGFRVAMFYNTYHSDCFTQIQIYLIYGRESIHTLEKCSGHIDPGMHFLFLQPIAAFRA